MRVTSAPGKGTRFELLFPAAVVENGDAEAVMARNVIESTTAEARDSATDDPRKETTASG